MIHRLSKNPGGSVTVSALIGLVLWVVLGELFGSSSFPHPFAVLGRFPVYLTDLEFWSQTVTTLILTVAGLGLGAALALIFGVALARSKFVELSSLGTVYFLRSIPAIVLLPLFVASLGASSVVTILLTALVVFLKLVVFVNQGVRDIDPVRFELTKLMRLRRRDALTLVVLPSILVLLGTGIRLSAQRAYGAVIAAGLLIGTPGLGSSLRLAQINNDVEGVFALALTVALVGVGIFYALLLVERRVAPWLHIR